MSLNPDIAAQAKINEQQLAEFIISAANDVFDTMIQIGISSDYPLQEPVTKFKCSITSMVGFAGTYSGVVSMHCPMDLAKSVTTAMLGLEESDLSEDNSDLNDAIGEIANMLGGNIKMILSKGGMDVKLSVPTVISGEEYSVEILSDVDCVVIPFTVNDSRFLVGLTLKKED